MGRTFPAGRAGGIEALAFLADHPATHRRLATKLVRHFIADEPPPDAVRDRRRAARHAAAIWAPSAGADRAAGRLAPGTKLRAPHRLRGRRTARAGPAGRSACMLRIAGRPRPAALVGTAAEWLAGPRRGMGGPGGMLRRIDLAYSCRRPRRRRRRPGAIAEAIARAPAAPGDPAMPIRRAGSRREAMALLLSSPEFQRR